MFAITLNDVLALGTLAVIGLVGLGVAVFLLIGLFHARSLVRREFMAYFLSPIAYVVMVVFLIVTGYLFYLTLQQLTADGPKGVEFPMQMILGDFFFWMVFLFIPPLLTMRLFAEERGTGTLETLMTAPLRDWQVVLSKYVACFAFYVVLWLPTLAYLPILCDLQRPEFHESWTFYSVTLVTGLALMLLSALLAVVPAGTPLRVASVVLLLLGVIAAGVGSWGHYAEVLRGAEPLVSMAPPGIDAWPVVASYLGIALVGAMFLALGLLVSSLVRSQMVAALVSLVLSLAFIVPAFWWPEMDINSLLNRSRNFVSVPLHFSKDFTRGLVDTRHLTLYASVAVFSLFLTVRSLEGRRWR
jgi:ABC-type transport system involved in multi-copper enzyme maturation permease subunit